MEHWQENSVKTRHVIVRCEHDLHMRVAAQVVHLVQNHKATVRVLCDGCRHANGCSILELLMLGAGNGKGLDVIAEGQDEELVVEKLLEIFEQGAGI